MSLSLRALILGCGLLLAAPSLAGAQEARLAEARGLFEAGRAAYEAARYDEALEYFERSFALAPSPSILYNAARSAERAGRLERAVELYEQVVVSSTEGEERAEATQRLAELRPRLEAQAARQTSEPATSPEVVEAEPSATIVAGDSTGAGVAILSAGAALVALGAVLLAIGIADADAIGNTPDETRSWSDVRGDLDRAYALDGFGVGSAAIGVTGVAVGIGVLASGGSETAAPTALRVSVRGQF